MSERITAEQVQSDVESYALRASPDGRRRVIREALDKARREGGEDAEAEVARLREVIATKYAIERSSLGVSALVEERGTIALAAGLGADASAAEVAARVGEMRGALVAIGRYDEFDRKRLAPTAHAYGHHAEAVDFARRLAEEAGRG